MKIKEIMTKDLQIVSPEESVKEAAQKMKQFNIGVLPVYNGTELVGILTDRDIAIRCDAAGYDPNQEHVSEIMTGQVEWCFDDDNVSVVARKMEQKQLHRLPVENHDKKLVGIVSLSDITLKSSKELACKVLEKISANSAK